MIIVSFQDDNPWGKRTDQCWMWSEYFRLVPLVDLHVVKRSSDAEKLKELGATQCYTWNHGIFTPLFHPKKAAIKYPISFVGTCLDDRACFIESLLRAKIPIHVFGSHWKRRSALPSHFPDNFHDPVKGLAYAQVIQESQLCLGLVSHSNCDEWTMRTFETIGCAKALVAERTPAHCDWFEEDSEIVLFSNVEECAQKIQQLLKFPEKCEAIGSAALAKCMAQKWTLDSRMEELLSQIFSSD
ncbi:MAG: glycosyltransferase [bacterium]|nr:glycosyltransferase [bacterium]